MLVLIGPGGVGKGTIAKGLVARDDALWLSRSWTTRPVRPSESGEEYVFVTRDAFEQAIRDGAFFEWAEFHGNLYGTPVPTPPAGHDVLLEIDVQGAEQVKERDADAVVILVTPPSSADLESRLRNRGDSAEHVERRLTSSEAEMERGRRLSDYVVVNDDLDAVITEIFGILTNVRHSR